MLACFAATHLGSAFAPCTIDAPRPAAQLASTLARCATYSLELRRKTALTDFVRLIVSQDSRAVGLCSVLGVCFVSDLPRLLLDSDGARDGCGALCADAPRAAELCEADLLEESVSDSTIAGG